MSLVFVSLSADIAEMSLFCRHWNSGKQARRFWLRKFSVRFCPIFCRSIRRLVLETPWGEGGFRFDGALFDKSHLINGSPGMAGLEIGRCQ